MSYFRNFPSVDYQFASDDKPVNTAFPNLTITSEVIQSLIDNDSLYQLYTVRDGERSDVVSQRLYGTTDYYWTFYLLNEDIRNCGWPLSEVELTAKMNEDIPGEVLVFLPQDEVDLGNDTNWLQHAMIEQFSVGDRIFGQVSGAAGTIYARNVNLGQMFVELDEGSPGFVANEVVVDVQGAAPNSQLTVRIVHSPAHLAIHHVEDGDGDHVDVDYALDFRGRGPESNSENVSGLPDGAGPGPDGNYIGGVVGDIENPDIYADSSPYTIVTFKDYYDEKNDNLSQIKVIKPGAIGQVVRLFNNSLKNS